MEKIWQAAQGLQEELVVMRRDLHKHPESGWTEFRTASIVVKELEKLGYAVAYGAEVVDEASMMGVPSEADLQKYMERAISEGADEAVVAKMAGGKTGVVAVLDSGKPGKTVGFRFDMDCNDVEEYAGADHRPIQEGFSSCHANAMHACGNNILKKSFIIAQPQLN